MTQLTHYGTLSALDEHELEHIPFSELEMLPGANGQTWGKLRDGRYLTALRERLPVEAGNPFRPDQIAIIRTDRIENTTYGRPGGGHSFDIHEAVIEATLSTPEAYEEARQRDAWKVKRTQRLANPPIRPVDRLATHPLLARKLEQFVPLGAPGDDMLRTALSKASQPPIVIEGRDPITGPEAILAMLAKRGIELRLSPDRDYMFAVSAKGVTVDVANLVGMAGPLLHAFLQGDPLTCSLPGHQGDIPLAATLLVGGAPACAEHAAGSVGL